MWQWINLRIKIWVQPELAKTRDLLRQANIAWDKALRENMNLKNRNDALKTQLDGLEGDVRDLQRELARERATTESQACLIASMEQNQRQMQKAMAKAEAINEALKYTVIKLEAERGRLTDFRNIGPKDN